MAGSTPRRRRRTTRSRSASSIRAPARSPTTARSTSRATAGARLRDQRHRQGRRAQDRADRGRRRGRPGQGGLRREGPDRQGRQDHRRLDLLRRGLQVAPIAAQNKVLFISGAGRHRRGDRRSTATPSAPAGSPTRTWCAAKSFIGDARARRSWSSPRTAPSARPTWPRSRRSSAAGGRPSRVLVPRQRHRVHPVRRQIKAAKPTCSSSPGRARPPRPCGRPSTSRASSRPRRSSPASTSAVDLADVRRGRAGDLDFLSHYFDEASDNEVDHGRRRCASAAGTVDLFHPDGFTAAQMIVRAVEQGGDDVEKMVTALEGWSFDGVKGKMTIRAEDHALLQPMFQAKRLVQQRPERFRPTRSRRRPLDRGETAPPVERRPRGPAPMTGCPSSQTRGLALDDRRRRDRRRRLPRRRARRVPGRDRPQRRRQDLPVQPDLRPAPGHRGPDHAARAGHHRRARPPPGPARAGPYLPDPRRCSPSLTVLENVRLAAQAHRRQRSPLWRRAAADRDGRRARAARRSNGSARGPRDGLAAPCPTARSASWRSPCCSRPSRR